MRRLLILAVALGLANAAAAQPLDESDVVSGKTVLDPTSGYILLHGTGRQGGTFIRVPDAEDLEAYRKDRQDAFAKAQARYAKSLKIWESDVKLAAEQKRRAPEKPVEPTEENFSIGVIEGRTAIRFGPDFAYHKDKANNLYTYAMSVKPGTYIWYGPVLFSSGQGFIGLCYCMGSVMFEVRSGVITNLGNSLFAAPLAERQQSAPLLDIRHNGGLSGFKVEVPTASAPVSFAVPRSLGNWPTVEADFRASGKSNNIYGVMISRLPPVPGVLAYDRDRIIDLKAETAASSPEPPTVTVAEPVAGTSPAGE